MAYPSPADLRAQASQLATTASAIERIQQLRSQAAQLTSQADQIEAALPKHEHHEGCACEQQPAAASSASAPAPATSIEDHVNSYWQGALSFAQPLFQ